MTETANPLPGVRRIFTRLTVDIHFNPIVSNQVLVEWALDPAFIEPGPYKFTLQCGASASLPDAEWTSVAEVIDQPWAYDRNPRFPQKGSHFFYRVVLEDGNGQTYISQAADGSNYWERYDWTIAREIIRKETMLLRKRAGVKGYLFKRRVFGDRCPCTDPETDQTFDPTCPTCYGTGFIDGYYEPFEYWVLMNPTQQIKKLDADQGLLTENLETVRALAYPAPEPNDFWVNANTDQRYIIKGDITALARHRGINLVLNLRLEERGRSEAIYLVPLPCGS